MRAMKAKRNAKRVNLTTTTEKEEEEEKELNGKITWSSEPGQRRRWRRLASQGPTPYAASRVTDELSAFLLLFTARMEQIVLVHTNREGSRSHGSEGAGWTDMDVVELRAYVGLLLLTGVFRSWGEAAVSLWDAECGRPVFPATMPLERFYTCSKALRFDDRATRPARHASDELAAVRELWDEWSSRLPLLYDPGREVTVDEQLVPFRGRCPFRQYMPSKPTRYGVKIWAACDARSSYAWNMQVYTGKAASGEHEKKNQGLRVVLDVTRGLGGGRNVTCNNFFTSYELAERLLARDLTVVGMLHKNRPELPAWPVHHRHEAFSSEFAFTPSVTLVSYVPKRNQSMLLLSTAHGDAAVAVDRPDRKPEILLHYNRNKDGVDNLDKLVTAYSCRRRTRRWPTAVFHNILDVSAYNAFVLWQELNPEHAASLHSRRNARRLFLERLGKALVAPLVQRRAGVPRAPAEVEVGDEADVDTDMDTELELEPEPELEPEAVEQRRTRRPEGATRAPRKRCQVCPPRLDRKTSMACARCAVRVCGRCYILYCPACDLQARRGGREATERTMPPERRREGCARTASPCAAGSSRP
ncbi:piggyBac transposable element-derived protein 4-like [Myripristis murdjan]|uniref:piggyBac transposable element-derived protein 4-like n=1 Tax=Myripristis murdjan TaxID=586833 RepID=UPI00117605C0|nr:piggyBac transposable element-derived protein 4-like [Myripristis murdjan]